MSPAFLEPIQYIHGDQREVPCSMVSLGSPREGIPCKQIHLLNCLNSLHFRKLLSTAINSAEIQYFFLLTIKLLESLHYNYYVVIALTDEFYILEVVFNVLPLNCNI